MSDNNPQPRIIIVSVLIKNAYRRYSFTIPFLSSLFSLTGLQVMLHRLQVII